MFLTGRPDVPDQEADQIQGRGKKKRKKVNLFLGIRKDMVARGSHKVAIVADSVLTALMCPVQFLDMLSTQQIARKGTCQNCRHYPKGAEGEAGGDVGGGDGPGKNNVHRGDHLPLCRLERKERQEGEGWGWRRGEEWNRLRSAREIRMKLFCPRSASKNSLHAISNQELPFATAYSG